MGRDAACRGDGAAVEHLAELGHARIAFFGGRADLEHVRVREASWRAALSGAGLAPGPVAHAGDPEALLRQGPTAVVCASDVLALAVVAAARSLGLDVPGDVSVTGFDDSPLAALASPALTSVRVDYAEFGEAATRRCWPRSAAGRRRSTRRRRRSWWSALRRRGRGSVPRP